MHRQDEPSDEAGCNQKKICDNPEGTTGERTCSEKKNDFDFEEDDGFAISFNIYFEQHFIRLWNTFRHMIPFKIRSSSQILGEEM